jgi:hypothetical protein
MTGGGLGLRSGELCQDQSFRSETKKESKEVEFSRFQYIANMDEKALKSLTMDQLLKVMIMLTDEVVEMHTRLADRQLIKEKLTKLQLVQKVIIEKRNQSEN